MSGPGQTACDMHPQELGAVCSLHCCAVDVEWWVTVLFVPEVDNDLFCFIDIQDQVVGVTPVCQMFHLLPVGLFVVVPDESHHCCIVRVLYDVVGTEPGA